MLAKQGFFSREFSIRKVDFYKSQMKSFHSKHFCYLKTFLDPCQTNRINLLDKEEKWWQSDLSSSTPSTTSHKERFSCTLLYLELKQALDHFKDLGPYKRPWRTVYSRSEPTIKAWLTLKNKRPWLTVKKQAYYEWSWFTVKIWA